MSITLYTSAEVAQMLRLNPQVVQRKLQAGEIPGYRIGKEWRVDHDHLRAWLESRSNQRAATPEEKVLAAAFGPDGRLRALPAPRAKRDIVLRRLVEDLEPGRAYQETEVNDILRRYHDDVATVRRELVMTKLVVRTPRGVYKRSGPRKAALSARK